MEMPPSPSPSSRSLAPFSSASSSLSDGSNQPSGEDSASIVTGTQVFIHVFFCKTTSALVRNAPVLPSRGRLPNLLQVSSGMRARTRIHRESKIDKQPLRDNFIVNTLREEKYFIARTTSTSTAISNFNRVLFGDNQFVFLLFYGYLYGML